jgi:hypothetical protein
MDIHAVDSFAVGTQCYAISIRPGPLPPVDNNHQIEPGHLSSLVQIGGSPVGGPFIERRFLMVRKPDNGHARGLSAADGRTKPERADAPRRAVLCSRGISARLPIAARVYV